MNSKRNCVILLTVALFANVAIKAADEAKPVVSIQAIAVGDALPAFESVDDTGKVWKSSEHIGKGMIVMYFYPGDFTGGCIRQAQAYRDGLEKIESLGVEVVGVSGDEAATHSLFKKTFGLKHGLLSDTKGELAKILGVPVSKGGQVRPIDADRKPLLDAEGKPMMLPRPVTLARWTIVADRDGKIVSIREVKNPAADIETVLKIVQGLEK